MSKTNKQKHLFAIKDKGYIQFEECIYCGTQVTHMSDKRDEIIHSNCDGEKYICQDQKESD